jgi:hypothetical protein
MKAKKVKKPKAKTLIGRREKVDFPHLGLYSIIAKVDTGAYTTALHCHDIHIEQENGKDVLCFKLLDPTHPEYNEKAQRFTDFDEREIKNTSGIPEKRFVIKTRVKLAGRIINSLISLTDRGNMRYPVLIGRRLLRNRFVVDVYYTDLSAE